MIFWGFVLVVSFGFCGDFPWGFSLFFWVVYCFVFCVDVVLVSLCLLCDFLGGYCMVFWGFNVVFSGGMAFHCMFVFWFFFRVDYLWFSWLDND